MKLEHQLVILFQGDSITDAGRDRDNPSSLGNGYVHFIAARLAADLPELGLRFVNRGISGLIGCYAFCQASVRRFGAVGGVVSSADKDYSELDSDPEVKESGRSMAYHLCVAEPIRRH